MFVLYVPAAKAGFVADFTGWLDQIKNHGFWEYINRNNFRVHSLYQVTQFNTWVFYHLFGIHEWPWHLLFITLHVINATLLFTFCKGILDDVGVENSREISFTGVVLFCVSPYLSEVVVWEPSFHFLQGLLMILLILTWVRKYLQTSKARYAVWAGIVYLLSTHTLEVFYITPWLVLTLAMFYRAAGKANNGVFLKVLLLFFMPELTMFGLRLIEFRVLYGGWVSRIGSDAAMGAPLTGLGKPAKYLFHLLFMGRFFSNDLKHKVYDLLDGTKCIVAFYGIVVLILGYIVARFRAMGGKGKVASLLFVWVLITFALLLPLWFGDLLLVIYDRYTYFTGAFFYMLLAVLAGFITIQYVRLAVVGVYALVNLRFAIQVSRYWGKSYKVNYGLLHGLPPLDDKIVVLLNLPESMHGIAMIGSEPESEYKLMHDLLLPESKIRNKVYDGLSYNMETPEDGANTKVLNDSMVRVTLNQWGTWWWYEAHGGRSYENEDYKLNMIDGGHFYELTMKHLSSQYLLLYQVGDKWHAVDMSKRDVDQN